MLTHEAKIEGNIHDMEKDESRHSSEQISGETGIGFAGRSGWITTKAAAKALGVSRRTVQNYVHRGLLTAREEGEGV